MKLKQILNIFTLTSLALIASTAQSQINCQTPEELRVTLIQNPNGKSFMYVGGEKIGEIKGSIQILKLIANAEMTEGTSFGSQTSEGPGRPDTPPPPPPPPSCHGPFCPGGITFFTKNFSLIIYKNNIDFMPPDKFDIKIIPKEISIPKKYKN